MSEDCLYLNVYAPITPGPHPVIFWMHGGALFLGQSDDYDPTWLVAKDVVVVTINYRLGALGYMAHPALSAEQGGASGNYGLMDQQFALHWVQDNIAAFGGDPGNVTIAGESAGGFSVHMQLIALGSQGLFHKAIVESGAYGNNPNIQPTLQAAEQTGAALMGSIGCTDACTPDALRALSLDAILTAQKPVTNWIAPVDTKVLTSSLADAFLAGNFQKVPVIEGSNHDEYRLFVAQGELQNGAPLSAAAYPLVLNSLFGPQLGPVLANVYAPANYPSPSLALSAAGTDVIFACAGRTAAKELSAFNPPNTVFAFEFADEASAMLLLPAVSFPYGAAHTNELQFLWILPAGNLVPEEQVLSEIMISYWTNFAKTGDPNGPGLPTWPAYGLTADNYLSLSPDAIRVTNTFQLDHKCR